MQTRYGKNQRDFLDFDRVFRPCTKVLTEFSSTKVTGSPKQNTEHMQKAILWLLYKSDFRYITLVSNELH